MVLQRDKPIKIWGWADPKEKIIVNLAGKIDSAITLSDSTWQLELSSLSAGGPYMMTVLGKNQIIVSDILIGDIWICGGQSNMEWTLKMCGIYDYIIKSHVNDKIRHIDIDNKTSNHVEKDITSKKGWQKTNPENTGDFSAVGYFFALEVSEKNGIPIGLVANNWSGSPAETWMSPQALASFPTISDGYKEKEAKLLERKLKMRQRNTNLSTWITNAYSLDSGKINGWEKGDFKTSQWSNITMPGMINKVGLGNFDGIIWFKTEFTLPPEMEGKDLILNIGKIDDMDNTWINGIKIGSTSVIDKIIKYKISSEIVKKGLNSITIQVLDHGGNGGIEADSIILYTESKSLNLSGTWKYKTGYDFKKMPEFIQPDWEVMDGGWKPSGMYHAMIAPMFKFQMKGVIWYQGEGNAGRAYEYRKLFPALINNWRNGWKQGDFPFLYVQLANFLKPDATPKTDPWPELREAQTMTLSLPNTGMAVTIDIGEENDIHPKNKADVGNRLAKIAQKIVYKNNIVHSGPIYAGMKIEGSKIRVSFNEIGSGLICKGNPQEFVIAGEDQKFYWANAIIEGNSIVVSSPKVTKPIAVRYAWSNNPAKANVYNKEGLPASPFRTDKWKGVTYGVTKID